MRLRSKRAPVEEWPQQRPRRIAEPKPPPPTLADLVAAERAIADTVEPSDLAAAIAAFRVESGHGDSS